MNHDRSLLLTLALPLFVAPIAACDADKSGEDDTDADTDVVDSEPVDTEVVDTEVVDSDTDVVAPTCGDGVATPDMVCFGAPTTYSAEGSAEAVLLADWDGDGLLDLVYGSFGSVYWTKGKGDGTFGDGGGQVSVGGTSSPIADLAQGDLDADGDVDVVVASPAGAALAVFGDGAGNNVAQQGTYTGEGYALDVDVADIFGTSASDDIVEADQYCGSVTVLSGMTGEGMVGTSQQLCSPDLVAFARTSDAHTAALATFDQDVRLTPLTYGEGVLSLGSAATATLDGTPARLVAADFDGDGYDDAAVLVAGEVDVLFTDGADGWVDQGDETYVPYTTTAGAADLAAGDVDGDGDVDLVLVDPAYDGLGFLLNDGDGVFTATATVLDEGAAPTRVTLGDVNQDGLLDLLVATEAPGDLTVLVQDP